MCSLFLCLPFQDKMEFWKTVFTLILVGRCVSSSELITNETLADQWVWEYHNLAVDEFYESSVAAWNFFTNLTDHNSALSVSLIQSSIVTLCDCDIFHLV